MQQIPSSCPKYGIFCSFLHLKSKYLSNKTQHLSHWKLDSNYYMVMFVHFNRVSSKNLLQIHFRGYPGNVLIPCEGEDSVKWSFINALKEVRYKFLYASVILIFTWKFWLLDRLVSIFACICIHTQEKENIHVSVNHVTWFSIIFWKIMRKESHAFTCHLV